MNIRSMLLFTLCCGLAVLAAGCKKKGPEPAAQHASAAAPPEFSWQIDQFADLRILRYQVPGFEGLTPRQKELVYYLSEAALCGRDIFFDQNYKHNLKVRRTLDAVVQGYQGDRNDPRWAEFMTYVKRVWFANGIHHHYSNDKFVPGSVGRRPPRLPEADRVRPGGRPEEGVPGFDEGPGRELSLELLRRRHPGRGRGLL
jgi:hypothetical protein